MHWLEWAARERYSLSIEVGDWLGEIRIYLIVVSRTKDPTSFRCESLEACIEAAQKVYGGPDVR